MPEHLKKKNHKKNMQQFGIWRLISKFKTLDILHLNIFQQKTFLQEAVKKL